MILKDLNINPNKLHDYLISKGCNVRLFHNAEYNKDNGEKIKEATEIIIEGESDELLDELVSEFLGGDTDAG